jgi:hypothetical protein
MKNVTTILLSLWCSVAAAQPTSITAPQPNPNAIQADTSGNYGRWSGSPGSAGTGNFTTVTFNGRSYNVADFSVAIHAVFPGTYNSVADIPAGQGGYTLDNIVWTFHGQNGRGACSGRGCVSPTYLEYSPATLSNGSTIDPPLVYLTVATPVLQPLLDANGAPVLDANGNPVMVPVTAPGLCGAFPCDAVEQWQDVGPATFVDGTPATFIHSYVPCTVWGKCDQWRLNGHLPAEVTSVVTNADGTTTTTITPILYLVHVTGSACGGFNCGIQLNNALTLAAAITAPYHAPPPTCGAPGLPPCDE